MRLHKLLWGIMKDFGNVRYGPVRKGLGVCVCVDFIRVLYSLGSCCWPVGAWSRRFRFRVCV